MPANHGEFSGDPHTRWIASSSGFDREMELLEDFWYDDPSRKRWTAPAGRVINGASIPEPLWAIVGSPYTGCYRNASVVHDIACEEATTRAARKAADRMYFHACLRGGCSRWEAIVQYLGVRIGAWLPHVALWRPATKIALTASAQFQRDAAAQSMITTFYEMAADVEPRADTIAIEEVEAIAERHLKNKAGL